MKMKQKNDFNGANFNGSTQIGEQRTTIQGDQYNVNQYNNYANNQLDNEKTKVYTYIQLNQNGEALLQWEY